MTHDFERWEMVSRSIWGGSDYVGVAASVTKAAQLVRTHNALIDELERLAAELEKLEDILVGAHRRNQELQIEAAGRAGGANG